MDQNIFVLPWIWNRPQFEVDRSDRLDYLVDSPSFEEFLLDVRASIPISIFFCANFRDLDQSESFSSEDSDRDPVFGQAQKESIQDLKGSFCKLQNSYSVYFLHDLSQTIREGT